MNRKNNRTIYILIISCILILFGLVGLYITLNSGLTTWGINNDIPWGISIVNFVFWIGVSHAGTLISAILYLMRQEWRLEIHRLAETMTLISLLLAVFFPWIHTGRPWFAFYWMFPYPSQMGVWVNFQSPLVWDFFAIFTYFVVSLIFWYLSLIPDFAIIKNDYRNNFHYKIYDFLSLGWNNTNKQKLFYGKTYLILAGLITPLVISVHSIVSYDFSAAILPGWHSTIFPVYFVIGAIFSGVALVNLISVLTMYLTNTKDKITVFHFDKLNKILLTTGCLLALCYLTELFFQLYSGEPIEKNIILARFTSHYSFSYILAMLFCAVLPQILWFEKIRKNIKATIIISFLILIGMWLERFGIIVISLHNSYVRLENAIYNPTLIDYSLLAGSIGFFLLLYLLFLKFIPVFQLNEFHKESK